MLNKAYNCKILFFALASTWAALAPWLFVLSINGIIHLPYGVVQHGQSMLFGFTSALITGYLAGKRPAKEIAWLVSVWLMTRIIEVFTDFQTVTAILYLVYGVHLAAVVTPKFFSAKKIINRLISPILGVISCFPIVFILVTLVPVNRYAAYSIFIQVLTLLMFFMAGRMITPLLSRANGKNGLSTPHRVQPSIEHGVFAAGFISILLILFNSFFQNTLSQVALTCGYIAISLFIIIRIFRWRPWNVSRNEAPLWSLFFGYTWLAVAQLFLAFSYDSVINFIPSLHIITIAVLGLFSSTIMTISVSKKANLPASVYFLYALCISGAAISRYLASIYSHEQSMLLFISLVLWSITFLLVLKAVLVASYKTQKATK